MALNVRTLFRFPDEGRHFEIVRKIILARDVAKKFQYARKEHACRVCGGPIYPRQYYLILGLNETYAAHIDAWENYKICLHCEAHIWYYAGKPNSYYGITTDRGRGETS